MRVTEDEVRQALREVIDPELGINIVDLGLVYTVEVRRQNSGVKVYILMTLTTPGCPLAGIFDQLVREALQTIPGVDVHKDVEIELTFDPPWVESMMTEESRAQLGID